MMRQYELVERVLSYDPKADEALLNRAYVYAMKAHGNQKRASGESYFSHPLEVAAILTDLKLDDATIVTALLHDVIEDTPITRAEIDQLFGPEIGKLVDGLTKIRRLDLVSKKAEQAENFRKLLVAISSDIRVLLVKLADRVHNMRTLEHMKPETRKRISEETLDIYAPLAARMGMEKMREELEDHAFRWLHPDAYAAVTAKLTELRKSNEGLVEEIRVALVNKLAEVGIDAEVSGREKKAYAIWRKMANKQISLEQLSDIYAFRVISKSIDDCYRVLGVAHTTWRTVPGRFKDYISTPKQNNYQSIHTTIVGPRHQRVELQIRTRVMHDIAEYGVAAHAIYKDAIRLNGYALARTPGEFTRTPDLMSGCAAWSRRCSKAPTRKSSSSTPSSSCSRTRYSASRPRAGSSPCRAAQHRSTSPTRCTPTSATPPSAPLSTAASCRSTRSCATATRSRSRRPRTTPRPRPGKIGVTGRARSAIRRAARDAVRKQYSELGRRLIASHFERLGEELTDDKLKKALPRLGYKSLEDVLAAVGRNELAIENVLRAAIPEAVEQAAQEADLPPHPPLRARPRPGGLVQHRPGDEPQVPRPTASRRAEAGAGLPSAASRTTYP